MSILPKAIDRFNRIPIKILMTYFTDLEKYFKNLFGSKNDPEKRPSATLRNKNKVGGTTVPVIKLYYKVTVIKTVW